MSLQRRDDVDLVFLYYYFSFLDWNKIASGNEKVKGKTLNKKSLSEIPVAYIPLMEQHSIVSRLDAAFAHIDALKANAERQLAETRQLFQAELAECMRPKEGWEEKTLGNITTSMADGPFGSNLKKEHYTANKEVRIIQLSNIGEEGWREENTKYTTFEHLKTIQRSEVLPGDIVIAKMMPAGRAILCPDKEKKYVLSSDAVRATLKDGLDNRFVLFSINSDYFRKQVYANVSGSGRVRTSLTKLRDCKLYLPSVKEQHSIVSRLDALSANIKKLGEVQRKTLAECDALKQAMLREVFE
jgi:restriction endonuclease S subunit